MSSRYITLKEGDIPPAGYVLSRVLRGRNVYENPHFVQRTRRRRHTSSMDDLADMFGNLTTEPSVIRPSITRTKTRKRRTRRMDVVTELSPIQEEEMKSAPFYNTVRRRQHKLHKLQKLRQSKAREWYESKLSAARNHPVMSQNHHLMSQNHPVMSYRRPVMTHRRPVMTHRRTKKTKGDEWKHRKDYRSRILSQRRGI